MAGDAIVSIDGTVINSIDAFKAALAENVGKNMQIDVRNKNDVTNTMAVLGYLDPPATGVSIGAVKTESLPFWRAVPQSAVGYWNILLSFKKGIVATIQGTVPFEAAGPVGIAQATVQVARLGIAPLLSFAAFISINLGIVNILPLPALDGGRIFFVLLEWVRRGKRVSPKTENLVHAIGFVLLITLMLLATWGDISRIMSGRSLGP